LNLRVEPSRAHGTSSRAESALVSRFSLSQTADFVKSMLPVLRLAPRLQERGVVRDSASGGCQGLIVSEMKKMFLSTYF
jgi:hypothetical protein